MEYGKWNTLYQRLAWWAENGVWQRMFASFVDTLRHGTEDEAPLFTLISVGQVHKKSGDQALGRSRSGFSTKIQARVDGVE